MMDIQYLYFKLLSKFNVLIEHMNYWTNSNSMSRYKCYYIPINFFPLTLSFRTSSRTHLYKCCNFERNKEFNCCVGNITSSHERTHPIAFILHHKKNKRRMYVHTRDNHEELLLRHQLRSRFRNRRTFGRFVNTLYAIINEKRLFAQFL